MSEIQGKADSGGKGGKKRAKKMSTKIDMTPMVDLAFLLLTFFMLTTTFAKPNVMQLTMPVKKTDDVEDTKIKASQAMTIILGKDNKAYYYFGLNTPNDKSVAKPEMKVTNFAANGIRQVILDRQRQAAGSEERLPIILIKPNEDSKYRNMVDILDEMNITSQKKYALVKMTKDDADLIKESGL